jgi:hypothetical protein
LTISAPHNLEVRPSRPINIPIALMQSPKKRKNKQVFFFPILGDKKTERKLKTEADKGM